MSSMKFLSTWLRNRMPAAGEHNAQFHSSMKFLSTWLRNAGELTLGKGGNGNPQ